MFPNENIIEEYFALNYRTDFTFRKHMLIVKIDGKRYVVRDPDYERKDKKNLKSLATTLLELILIKLDDYEEFGIVSAYVAKSIKKQTKKSLTDDLSKRLLELEVKSNHSIKIKVFKLGCQKHFTKLQKMKNTKSKIKPIKVGKQSVTMYCFGCKDYTNNFRPQEAKMTNKVLREKSHCVICPSNKSRFVKQKIN